MFTKSLDRKNMTLETPAIVCSSYSIPVHVEPKLVTQIQDCAEMVTPRAGVAFPV